MMTGARPSVGSSSSSKPGAGAQDAADRQHLLLAAGEFGALARAEPLLQIWKQFENCDRATARRAAPAAAAADFPRRRGSRKCRAPPGRTRCPAARSCSGGRPISSCPRSVIEPVRWPTMPMIDFRVVVLPAPLRPSSVTTSPSCTSKLTPWRMCDSPYQACRSFTASSGVALIKHGRHPCRLRALPDCSKPSRNRLRRARGRASAR